METKKIEKKKPAFYKDTISEKIHEKYNVGAKFNDFQQFINERGIRRSNSFSFSKKNKQTDVQTANQINLLVFDLKF